MSHPANKPQPRRNRSLDALAAALAPRPSRVNLDRLFTSGAKLKDGSIVIAEGSFERPETPYAEMTDAEAGSAQGEFDTAIQAGRLVLRVIRPDGASDLMGRDGLVRFTDEARNPAAYHFQNAKLGSH